jgi:hypothetical protein
MIVTKINRLLYDNILLYDIHSRQLFKVIMISFSLQIVSKEAIFLIRKIIFDQAWPVFCLEPSKIFVSI